MSVLNQSGEEQVECPLCMEPLEVDDLNFFPCTCGYQICRFCWHRIRTDENGLCPACRKAYSENPADFTPLSQEQVAKLKAEKRQRDQQRKAKVTENRKHLATVRVVQKNLVFVVGLPLRLADPEVLKRHDYFGKFGKIHKVVINQSTAYAGSQGPSASAYVTYMKSEDALRAIQNVNNVNIDGRPLKTSLGTTKYCSHFMKNLPCPKPDCMYLHDLGDAEASFTKEEMHAGKHQEYEKKLHDQLLQRTQTNSNTNSGHNNTTGSNQQHNTDNSKGASAKSKDKEQQNGTSTTTQNGGGSSKDTWPQLNNNGEKEKPDHKKDSKDKSQKGKGKSKAGRSEDNKREKSSGKGAVYEGSCNGGSVSGNCKDSKAEQAVTTAAAEGGGKPQLQNGSGSSNSDEISRVSESESSPEEPPASLDACAPGSSSATTVMPDVAALDDNSSFFSQHSVYKTVPDRSPAPLAAEDEHHSNTDSRLTVQADHPPAPHTPVLTEEMLPIRTTENWQAAFQDLFTAQRGGNGAPMKDPSEVFGGGATTNGYMGYGGRTVDPMAVRVAEISRLYEEKMHHENGALNSDGAGYKNGLYSKPDTMVYELGQKVLVNNVLQQNGMLQMLMDATQKHKQAYYNGDNGGQTLAHQYTVNGWCGGPSVDPVKTHKPLYTTQQSHLELDDQFLNLNLSRYCDIQQQQQQHQQRLLSAQQQQQKPFVQQQQTPHSNGLVSSPVNGTRAPPLPYMFPPSYVQQQHKESSLKQQEGDELDFDPIKVTQKALAEIIANEQPHKGHSSVPVNQMNGISHNHSGLNNLPPPPGFVQPNTHMNSFGSKILPFLNMANSQPQQQINGTTQNGWSTSYSQFQQQQRQQQLRPQQYPQPQQLPQQHKNEWDTCHDWKTLDPAILSSSRHFALANMPQARDHYTIQQQQQLESQQPPHQQQHQPPRYFDYNNFSQHLNGAAQQNLSWFTNELNSQINSPPGFRSAQQTSKQQEC